MKLVLLCLFIITSGQTVFATTNHLSNGEICISSESIPLDGADYKKNDLKNEESLCKLDFNILASNATNTAVALCPKLNSSFPGVDIVELKKGVNKLEFQKNSCAQEANTKNSGKLAKFKYSTSCANKASIIGYYHISRALGIKTVPPAVVRTMDINTHEEVISRANRYVHKSNEMIANTWRRLTTEIYEKKSSIVINGGTHSLGVLSKNPRGEQKTYKGVYFHADNQKLRLKRFLTESASTYTLLLNPQPVTSFIPKQLNSKNYTLLKSMKDVSDMLVLDTLFGQNDRFGNTHSEYKFAYIEGNQLKRISLKDVNKLIKATGDKKLMAAFKKAKDMPKDFRKPIRLRKAALLEVTLPFLTSQGIDAAFYEELMLKDNDCGLLKKNPFIENRVLDNISHMNAETYFQLLSLYNAIIKNSSMDGYLGNNLLMSDTDVSEFKNNLSYAAETLMSRYTNGQLHLDLDPSSYFLK